MRMHAQEHARTQAMHAGQAAARGEARHMLVETGGRCSAWLSYNYNDGQVSCRLYKQAAASRALADQTVRVTQLAR